MDGVAVRASCAPRCTTPAVVPLCVMSRAWPTSLDRVLHALLCNHGATGGMLWFGEWLEKTGMGVLSTVKAWAKRIRRDALTLWFAQKHPDTPLLPKLLCILTVAYALSPIDLIPDFIPVLGYLDEVILLPAFIWLTVRLLPLHVLEESRARAQAWLEAKKSRIRSMAGGVAIVLIWLGLAAWAWTWWTASA